jgi:NAD(P)-dependent dehydrogenase (short-subunit alcohol dehydrogenase family)
MPSDTVIEGLDAPANALVTGASSGVGLAVVRQLLQNGRVARVAAISRTASAHPELEALAQAHGERLLPISLDLTDDAALAALPQRLGAAFANLHLLFNAAGVLHAPGLAPEKSLSSLRRASLDAVFALNAFAPILLAQALSPLLRHAQPAVFASLSARVGSIGDNQLGGWYAYRASKAAQNQLLRTLSVEWKRTHPRAACVLLHPGTVDTPLSRPFQAHVPPEKLFAPQRAAEQLLRIVARTTPEHSGRFFAWDGSAIAW